MGSDHAGYALKESLKQKLVAQGFSVEDFGTFSNESVDYPDVIHPLACAIDQQKLDWAIIICGTGIGASMVANKYPRVRAALCWMPEISVLARRHNNANVLALPGRFIGEETAWEVVSLFLNTPFDGGRHQRRVSKIPRIMTIQKARFLEQAEKKAFDLKHRKTLNYNISRYEESFHAGLVQFENLENARQRAANIRHKVLERLDEYLIEFESNFKKRGGRVVWALSKKEAVREILHILKQHDVKLVVKSKSMLTEELELNEALARNGIEPVETDLGEYIVQLSGEKPYHILTPAMHKSKEDVSALFSEKFGLDANSTPEEVTGFVREQLRQKFLQAGAGITGANFLIADAGAVAITENEGNALMSVSFPGIHIVVAGIEKVIPSIADLHLFWPLLSSHGTGQYLTVYNSILTGPRKEDETDGPDEMIVILLDNNRTEVLQQPLHRRALSCIRCGACLNACPVYKNIGGHAYGTTYTGPIGAVISPYLNDFNQHIHLSFASSLCRHCTEVCPVKVNLHELLLHNRNEAVKRGLTSPQEKVIMKGWKSIMMRRYRMDFFGSGAKNRAMAYFFSRAWGKRRTLPVFSKRSFRQRWIENG